MFAYRLDSRDARRLVLLGLRAGNCLQLQVSVRIFGTCARVHEIRALLFEVEVAGPVLNSLSPTCLSFFADAMLSTPFSYRRW